MYIVVIGWIYVVLMMAITEDSVVAGIMTFLMYGVLPLAIILYLTGGRQRRRNRALLKKQPEDSNANSTDQVGGNGSIDNVITRRAEKNPAEAKHPNEN
jgi:hypothetical protein